MPYTSRYPESDIVPIIMARDNLDLEEAERQLDYARDEAQGVTNYDELEEILQDHFGLEPDYLFELLYPSPARSALDLRKQSVNPHYP